MENIFLDRIEKAFQEHMPSENRPSKTGYAKNGIKCVSSKFGEYHVHFRTRIGSVFFTLIEKDPWSSPMVIKHFPPRDQWPRNLVITKDDIPIARAGNICSLQVVFSVDFRKRMNWYSTGWFNGCVVGSGPTPTRKDLVHVLQATYADDAIVKHPPAIVPVEQ